MRYDFRRATRRTRGATKPRQEPPVPRARSSALAAVVLAAGRRGPRAGAAEGSGVHRKGRSPRADGPRLDHRRQGASAREAALPRRHPQVRENGKAVEVIAVEPVRRGDRPARPLRPTRPPRPRRRRAPVVARPSISTSRRRRCSAAPSTRSPSPSRRTSTAILRIGPARDRAGGPDAARPRREHDGRRGARRRARRPPRGPGQGEPHRRARSDYLQVIQDPEIAPGASVASPDPRMPAKASIQQEVQLLQNALGAIAQWAGTLPDDRPGIVYLGTDGFDADPSEVYRRTILALEEPSAAPGGLAAAHRVRGARWLACARTRNRPSPPRACEPWSSPSEACTPSLRPAPPTRTRSRRAASPRSARAAEVTYFARPTEPLRLIAAATGGEVVSTETKLAEQVGSLGGLYLVTFRTTAPADGTAHELSVTSAGLPSAQGQRAPVPRRRDARLRRRRENHEGARRPPSPRNEGLDVGVSVEAIGRSGKKTVQGELSVSADLAGIAPALEKLGAGRVRVTIAVESPGLAALRLARRGRRSITRASGTIWLYEAKFNWPPEATRVAVTIEELKTGASGTGVAELPKAALDRAAPHAVAGDEERGGGEAGDQPHDAEGRRRGPSRKPAPARGSARGLPQSRRRAPGSPAPPSARRAAPRRRARPRSRRRRRPRSSATSRARRHGPRHHRARAASSAGSRPPSGANCWSSSRPGIDAAVQHEVERRPADRVGREAGDRTGHDPPEREDAREERVLRRRELLLRHAQEHHAEGARRHPLAEVLDERWRAYITRRWDIGCTSAPTTPPAQGAPGVS